MESIITKIRDIIQDNAKHNKSGDLFEYSGLSKVFILEQSNVDENSIKVYKNGNLWDSDNYSYNSDTEEITVEEETGEELVVGDSLRVTYDYYEKYSDNELKGYIRASLSYLSVEKYGTFVIETGEELNPEPTEEEENLIALIASILIKGNIRSYRTPEITVTFADNESKEEKIRKILSNFNKGLGFGIIYVDLEKEFLEED